MNRENVKLLIVATVCLTAGWSGPAVAGAAVAFAQNSDKVDGKHAVGAGASTAVRKGKLVATSPTTGRLPNNIIAKAPDSAKLGGVSAANMRVLPMPTASLLVNGVGALNDGFGPFFPANANGKGFRTTFIVPPAHTSSTSIKVDMVIYSTSACTVGAQANMVGSLSVFSGTTAFPKVGDFYRAPLLLGNNKITFTVTDPIQPGEPLELEFKREPSQGACSIQVVGLQQRY